MSETALMGYVGVVDLLGAGGLLLAGAVGATIAGSIFAVTNHVMECDNDGVVSEYEDAMQEAIGRTKSYYRNRPKMLGLLEKLTKKDFEFDVDIQEALKNASELRQTYMDNTDVKEIVAVFDANFKFVAPCYPRLCRFLLVQSGESIIDTLNAVQESIEGNSKKLDDIASTGEETHKIVKTFKDFLDHALILGSELTRCFRQGIQVCFILGILFALGICEIELDRIAFYAIILFSEWATGITVKRYEFKHWAASILCQTAYVILLTVLCGSFGSGWLKTVVALLTAISAKYFLEHFPDSRFAKK